MQRTKRAVLLSSRIERTIPKGAEGAGRITRQEMGVLAEMGKYEFGLLGNV